MLPYFASQDCGSSLGKKLLLLVNVANAVIPQQQFNIEANHQPRLLPLAAQPQGQLDTKTKTKIVPSSAIKYITRDPTGLFSKTEPNNASVNAGSYNLVVGLGGINGAFASELRKISHSIGPIHRNAYKIALKEMKRAKSTSVTTSPLTKQSFKGANQPLSHTFVRLVPELQYDQPAGTVFIDVLGPNTVFGPMGVRNPNAQAMVYLVGPDGRQPVYENDPQKFLTAVGLTATNFVLALNEYNRANASNPLKSVRLCLFSGAIFRHPAVTAQQVANKIVGALMAKRENNVTPEIHCVDFPI